MMHIRKRSYFILLVCYLIVSCLISKGFLHASNGEYISCSDGGVCIPPYLCTNGTIITTGDGLIDLRLDEHHCPVDLVCCRDADAELQVGGCDATCVDLFQCLDDVFSEKKAGVNSYCPKNQVCCSKVRPLDSISDVKQFQKCSGRCVPVSQCNEANIDTSGEGLIDVRIDEEYCNGVDLVCCMEEEIKIPQLEPTEACNGKCVPALQCKNFTMKSERNGGINLRSFDDICSGDLVCCQDILIKSNCQGVCMPLSQCSAEFGKDALDLRYANDGCDEADFICCPKEILQKPTSKTTECKGTCVPFFQCQNGSFNTDGAGILIPRSQNGCQGDLVCCENEPVIQDISNQPICEGRCVPPDQCEVGSSNNFGLGLIDLRRSVNVCTDNLVCCTEKSAAPSRFKNEMQDSNNCKGICTPASQCNVTENNNIDLKSFAKCPEGLVCCESLNNISPNPTINVTSTIPTEHKCDQVCVPLVQCADHPTKMMAHIIDLRFGSGASGCQEGAICCSNPIQRSPEEENWIHWIQDMNNMVDIPKSKNKGKCYLNIVGSSTQIRQDEIPWLVTIWKMYQGEQRRKYLCTGASIRSDVVLVPASCVSDEQVDKLLIRLGNINLKSMNFQEFHITKKAVHPDYDKDSITANVALLFLSNKIKSPSACLYEKNEKFSDQQCLVVGWNNLDFLDTDTSSIIPKKQYLSISRLVSCPSHALLCTGRNESIENCDRLHGSAVICLDQSGQNWKIAGITASNNDHCDANGIPESLVMIPRHTPWIREQLSPSFVQRPADIHGPSRKYLPVL